MVSLRYSAYHSLLRISLLFVAFLLVFDSGLLSPKTAEVSQVTQHLLANAVGVKASVAPNELNVLTARITELETELSKKDRELNVAQAAYPNSGDGERIFGFVPSTLVLSAILFVLLVLVSLNYVLDYYRMKHYFALLRQERQTATSV